YFNKILDSGLEPLPETYDYIIYGYFRKNQPKKAEEFYAQMITDAVRPTIHTIAILLEGAFFGQDRKLEQFAKEEMQRLRLKPNSYVAVLLLKMCDRDGE